jgi:hypothetical protein
MHDGPCCVFAQLGRTMESRAGSQITCGSFVSGAISPHRGISRGLNMSRSSILAIVLAIVIATLPGVSRAWNIICINSNTRKTMEAYVEVGPVKWEADSHALRGISFYFLAVSELQRIDFQSEGLRVPRSLSSVGTSSLDQAKTLLSQSANKFRMSIDLAGEHELGDERGLQLLNGIHENVVSFHRSLENKILPQLDMMQRTAEDISQAVSHGITLSRRHLEMGTPGHHRGGVPLSNFSISD